VSPIRELERRDLADVARLHADAGAPAGERYAERLLAFFERTLLDHPWADSPSFGSSGLSLSRRTGPWGGSGVRLPSGL
jgi:plasmid stabilization system protein ParE